MKKKNLAITLLTVSALAFAVCKDKPQQNYLGDYDHIVDSCAVEIPHKLGSTSQERYDREIERARCVKSSLGVEACFNAGAILDCMEERQDPCYGAVELK